MANADTGIESKIKPPKKPVAADGEAKDTGYIMESLLYLTNKRKTAEGWTEEDFILAREIGALTDE